MEIRRALLSETKRVLATTLGTASQTPADLDRHVESFLLYAREMHLDLSPQWVACDGDHWRAACNLVESPGRTALLFLPADSNSPAKSTAVTVLVREALRFAADRGIRILQCLAEPESGVGTVLRAFGFDLLARLNYLERSSASANGLVSVGRFDGLSWIEYGPATHNLFALTIMATYEGSRDCPGLNGIRDIEDIIAGHKAAARHDPRRWSLLCEQNRPVGCLLLGEVPLRSALEIIYMGLRPPARGRGLAGVLLARAVEVARAARLDALTLAVDAGNDPARALYRRFGFQPTVSRDAWIAVLNSQANG